jgi:hypothetical protein
MPLGALRTILPFLQIHANLTCTQRVLKFKDSRREVHAMSESQIASFRVFPGHRPHLEQAAVADEGVRAPITT